jgi:hypothetical protein
VSETETRVERARVMVWLSERGVGRSIAQNLAYVNKVGVLYSFLY